MRWKDEKKTIIIFILLFSLLIVGCRKLVKRGCKRFNQKLKKLKVTFSGELEMLNNDDVYKCDVDVSYEQEDKFLC